MEIISLLSIESFRIMEIHYGDIYSRLQQHVHNHTVRSFLGLSYGVHPKYFSFLETCSCNPSSSPDMSQSSLQYTLRLQRPVRLVSRKTPIFRVISHFSIIQMFNQIHIFRIVNFPDIHQHRTFINC